MSSEVSGDERPCLDSKPACPYGEKCYRLHPVHFSEYTHPDNHEASSRFKRPVEETDAVASTSKKVAGDLQRSNKKARVDIVPPACANRPEVINNLENEQLQRIHLTTVKGIDAPFNDPEWTCTLKKILAPEMGNLQSSIQFNYMFDVPWLVEQYPVEFRTRPMLLVHGYKVTDESGIAIREEAALFPHISQLTAPLYMPFGTHHTKMMILRYDTGLRILIHTSNLIHNDWHQKTQGAWISPIFPKSTDGVGPDSDTGFKKDFVAYLRKYHLAKLDQIANEVDLYDMSAARVCLVASVPGRHAGADLDLFGHRKLRSVLKKHCPPSVMNDEWPVIGQFSSIGTLGPSSDSWLTGEFLETLSSPLVGIGRRPRLNMIFPSVDNVRESLEGWDGGGSLPYSIKVATKQEYLHKLFHVWKSDAHGRTHAMPHIKTYTRISPDLTQAGWFLITSANLSKAAWGALEKQSTQLMIRSYELGVLLLPKFADPSAETFTLLPNHDDAPAGTEPFIFLPYDLPLEEYSSKDRPWTYDASYAGLTDRFGRKRAR